MFAAMIESSPLGELEGASSFVQLAMPKAPAKAVSTVITMFIISVAAGLFVLNAMKKVTDEEQAELYEKLGVSMKKE